MESQVEFAGMSSDDEDQNPGNHLNIDQRANSSFLLKLNIFSLYQLSVLFNDVQRQLICVCLN